MPYKDGLIVKSTIMPKEERSHARLSGSTAHRWTSCHGSVSLIETLPVPPSSHAADLGTFAHSLAEIKLKRFLQHKVDGLDPGPLALPHDESFEDFEVERADLSTDEYVKIIWENVLEHSLTGKAYGFEDLFCLNKSLSQWGYIDFWVVYINDKARRVGVVVDYKNGYHDVSVEKNAQLAFYACALREFVRSHGKDLDEIRTVIFQPNTPTQKPYKEARLTSKQLDSWKAKFTKAARDIFANKKTPKFKVGSWCEFCPAQAICTAYAKETSKVLDIQLLDVSEIVLPKPETLSDENIKNIVVYGDMLEDFIKSCKAYALTRWSSGNPVAGTKVVLGPTKRCWRDDEQAISYELQKLGILEPWNKKLIGITAAEKLIGKGKLSELCTTSTAKTIIVSADDPRPSATSSIDLLPVLE